MKRRRLRKGRKHNPQTLPSQRVAFVIMANKALADIIVDGARTEAVSESRWLNDLLCDGFGISEKDR